MRWQPQVYSDSKPCFTAIPHVNLRECWIQKFKKCPNTKKIKKKNPIGLCVETTHKASVTLLKLRHTVVFRQKKFDLFVQEFWKFLNRTCSFWQKMANQIWSIQLLCSNQFLFGPFILEPQFWIKSQNTKISQEKSVANFMNIKVDYFSAILMTFFFFGLHFPKFHFYKYHLFSFSSSNFIFTYNCYPLSKPEEAGADYNKIKISLIIRISITKTVGLWFSASLKKKVFFM